LCSSQATPAAGTGTPQSSCGYTSNIIQLGSRVVFQPGKTCRRYWDTTIFLWIYQQYYTVGKQGCVPARQHLQAELGHHNLPTDTSNIIQLGSRVVFQPGTPAAGTGTPQSSCGYTSNIIQLGSRVVFQPGNTCSRNWDTTIFLQIYQQYYTVGKQGCVPARQHLQPELGHHNLPVDIPAILHS
jgi:hypothetical protein